MVHVPSLQRNVYVREVKNKNENLKIRFEFLQTRKSFVQCDFLRKEIFKMAVKFVWYNWKMLKFSLYSSRLFLEIVWIALNILMALLNDSMFSASRLLKSVIYSR